MNLQQQIGQLLVVGFKGTQVTDTIKRMIEDYHVGNIILFERNCQTPEQTFHLVKELQRIAMKSNGVPLFIATDQENGVVARVYDGVTVFPGSMAQSAGATVEETKMIANYTGIGLKALGINFNLAPSVDINNNPHNPVIGVRSFGETGEAVAERANAYIEGLQEAGVIATAKHFPGHGDTSVDSHLALPIVAHDKERLEKVELYPFKEAIKHGVKAIMSAHIKFPAYEAADVPATLSYNVLTQLLRRTLGFEGLIMTDCMEMKAIDAFYGTAKATPMAIAAGADLVCLSHCDQKQIHAIEEICHAIENGKIKVERIKESVERILREKANYDVQSFLDTSYEQVKTSLYQPHHQVLAEKVSHQSMTLLYNNDAIPIQAKEMLVVAPNGHVLTGADGIRTYPNFAKVFRDRVVDRSVEAYEIDIIPTETQIEEVIHKAKQKELIILCTLNGLLNESQIKLAKEVIRINENVILIPMRSPYDVEVIQGAKACVIPYEYTPRAMESLIQVLRGNIEAKGQLPITIQINN